MANWGQVDFSELVELRDKFQHLQDFLEDFYIYATKEVTQILKKNVISRTPVKEGTLQNAWTNGEVVKNGDCYSIEVINPIEYAEFVEFGHMQQPGRYVKAIGKRLKKGWVPGKFMLTIAERDLQRNINKIVGDKLEEFVAEALR